MSKQSEPTDTKHHLTQEGSAASFNISIRLLPLLAHIWISLPTSLPVHLTTRRYDPLLIPRETMQIKINVLLFAAAGAAMACLLQVVNASCCLIDVQSCLCGNYHCEDPCAPKHKDVQLGTCMQKSGEYSASTVRGRCTCVTRFDHARSS